MIFKQVSKLIIDKICISRIEARTRSGKKGVSDPICIPKHDQRTMFLSSVTAMFQNLFTNNSIQKKLFTSVCVKLGILRA